jgi:hypothetical protein
MEDSEEGDCDFVVQIFFSRTGGDETIIYVILELMVIQYLAYRGAKMWFINHCIAAGQFVGPKVSRPQQASVRKDYLSDTTCMSPQGISAKKIFLKDLVLHQSEKQLEQQSASNKALYQLDHHSR